MHWWSCWWSPEKPETHRAGNQGICVCYILVRFCTRDLKTVVRNYKVFSTPTVSKRSRKNVSFQKINFSMHLVMTMHTRWYQMNFITSEIIDDPTVCSITWSGQLRRKYEISTLLATCEGNRRTIARSSNGNIFRVTVPFVRWIAGRFLSQRDHSANLSFILFLFLVSTSCWTKTRLIGISKSPVIIPFV